MLSNTLRAARARLLATSAGNATKDSSITRVIGGTVFSGAVAYTSYLCWWQTQRYQWKVGLIAERTERLHAAPVAVSSLVASPCSDSLPPETEFRQVRTFVLMPMWSDANSLRTASGELSRRVRARSADAARATLSSSRHTPARSAGISYWCADAIRVCSARGKHMRPAEDEGSALDGGG